MSKAQFSSICSLNKGMVADVLNRKKPLSFKSYVIIMGVLNIPLEKYINEYFLATVSVTKHPTKIVMNIVNKCLEISRIDIAIMSLNYLKNCLESNKENSDHRIFDIAESLYRQNKYESAEAFYLFISNSVIENVNLDKIILSISYYRLFKIKKSNNAKVEDYALLTRLNLIHLPRNMRLNALYDLCLYFLLEIHDWEILEHLTKQMIMLVNEIIEAQKFKIVVDEKDEELLHALVRYYGQGYLMQSSAFRNKLDYQTAYELIQYYEDLSWFPNLNDEGTEHVERFKIYAEGNKYVLQLRMGNLKVAKDYMAFLNHNPNEFLQGIFCIVECANKIQDNLDSTILNKAIELIILREDIVYHHPYYNQKQQQDVYMNLIYQTSMYLIRTNQRQLGVDITLKFLESAILFRDTGMIVFALSILEGNKSNSTKDQIKTYEKIRGSMSNYEKTFEIRSNSA